MKARVIAVDNMKDQIINPLTMDKITDDDSKKYNDKEDNHIEGGVFLKSELIWWKK